MSTPRIAAVDLPLHRDCATSAGRHRAAGLLAAIAACLAFVAAPAQAATINVSAGQNLNQFIEDANDGDLILVAPGTYTAQATAAFPGNALGPLAFRIMKRVTVRATGGPGVTFLDAPPDAGQPLGKADYTVIFFATYLYGQLPVRNPAGAVLEGFTLRGAKGGVLVQDFLGAAAENGQTLNNITIRNVVVQNPFTTLQAAGTNNTHGINFAAVVNCRLEGATVAGYNNGINIQGGSANTLIANTVTQTTVGHAIALVSTTGNVVSSNAVTGSAFDGIIGNGATLNRIERNTLTGFKVDGITMTDLSSHNYIAQNQVPSTGRANGEPAGTGVWLNRNSHGNFVYNNDISGAPENGMSIWLSSSNFVKGNGIHGNFQGGMLLWNIDYLQPDGKPVNNLSAPTNNFIRSNFIFYNRFNASVFLRGAARTDIGWNFMSGHKAFGVPGDAGDSPGGVFIEKNPIPATGEGSSNTTVYGNTFSNLLNSERVDQVATNARLFRNRHLSALDKYTFTGAGVTWDGGGTLLGGNFWSDWPVSGNPSSGTPYVNFKNEFGVVNPAIKDLYPFQSESFGQAPAVSVVTPRAGLVAAAGSSRTISWDSRGCVYVDVHLLNAGGTPVSTLVTNFADVGHVGWTIPSGQAGGTYSIRVTCKNSAGTSVGVTGQSGSFTVAPVGLRLLAPGAFASHAAASTINVAWARGADVAVNVFLSVDGGAETLLASGISGNHASVTLPNVNTNRATIRIASGSMQDSVDGWFSIVAGSGAGITGINPGQTLAYNDRFRVEWKSVTNSRYVDLEVFNGSTYQLIAQNVPDFGHFEWFVTPDLAGSNRNIRITYKSVSATSPGVVTSVIGTVTSGSFSIGANAGGGGARTDFNADGRSDVLYRNGTTGQVYRLLANGLSLSSGAMAYTEGNTAWKIVADADFNGDGTADILYRNDATGAVYFVPFATTGLPSGGALVMTEPNLAWKIVHAPDLDGDGRADILYWNSTTGQVYAMLMNGAAIGTQGFVYTEANTAWKIVAVGDFAGSGRKNQLLWRNGTTGQVYLMTVTVSGGVFSQTGQMIYQEANTAWRIIGAADFNGDGKSDILWRNGTTGQVYLMLMNGGAVASQGLVYTEPNTAWKIVANGDYDGNGRADLLWRNDSTGALYMMLMNGLSVSSQGAVYAEGNLAWKVLGPWEYGNTAQILTSMPDEGKARASTLVGEPVNRGMIGGWPHNPSPGIDGEAAHR